MYVVNEDSVKVGFTENMESNLSLINYFSK